MLSVCVSELLSFTTPPLQGDTHAIQSFLVDAISISLLAFACASSFVAPDDGP